jgi:hypothetical protein
MSRLRSLLSLRFTIHRETIADNACLLRGLLCNRCPRRKGKYRAA